MQVSFATVVLSGQNLLTLLLALFALQAVSVFREVHHKTSVTMAGLVFSKVLTTILLV